MGNKERFYGEHDEDDEEMRDRLPAFFFSAILWLSSLTTRRMDAEQRGWYIQLLAEAWCNGNPQGTLPDDDAELRKMADFQPFSSSRVRMIMERCNDAITSLEDVMQEEIELQEKRWSSVKAAFVLSEEHPGLLHNKKLTRVLKEAKRYRSQHSKAGRASAAKRWGRRNVDEKPDDEVATLSEKDNDVRKLLRYNIREDLQKLEEKPIPSKSNGFSYRSDLRIEDDREISKRATEIFDYWKLEMLHPNSIFGSDRRSKVEARLREGYTVGQLKTAVLGCKLSDHNQGHNETGVKYEDIELICRSSSNVERFINIHNDSGKQHARRRESTAERRARINKEIADYSARLQHINEPPADALKLDSNDFE